MKSDYFDIVWLKIAVVILLLIVFYFMILDFTPKIVAVEEKPVVSEIEKKITLRSDIMNAIIFCESSYRPHVINKDTGVGEDVGYFQINTHYHESQAVLMGLDIYEPYDNIIYGIHLLETEGLKPWSASSLCWKKILDKEGVAYNDNEYIRNTFS